MSWLPLCPCPVKKGTLIGKKNRPDQLILWTGEERMTFLQVFRIGVKVGNTFFSQLESHCQ